MAEPSDRASPSASPLSDLGLSTPDLSSPGAWSPDAPDLPTPPATELPLAPPSVRRHAHNPIPDSAHPLADLLGLLSVDKPAESNAQAILDHQVGHTQLDLLALVNQLRSKLDQAEHDKHTEHQARLQAEHDKDAEHQARLQAEQDKDAEHQARLQAEHDKHAEHQARLQAEQDKQKELQARLQAEQDKHAEHQARLQAEQDKQKELQARLQAEQDKHAEHQARLQAEQDKQKEHQARLQAEKKAAEMHQARHSCLGDVVDLFHRIVLDDRAQRDKSRTQLGSLRLDRAMPHRLVPDPVMRDEVAQLIQWLDAILGDAACIDVHTVTVQKVSDDAARCDLSNESGFSRLIFDLIGSLVRPTLEALATRLLQPQPPHSTSTAGAHHAQQCIDRLKSRFSATPWHMLQNCLILHDVPPKRISKTARKAFRAQHPRPTTKFDPTTTRLHTDLFFTLRTPRSPGSPSQKDITFYMAELKVHNLGSAEKLVEFFLLNTGTSTAAADPAEPVWQSIDMEQLATLSDMDRGVLAAISQCTSYIPAHAIPFIFLTTGKATVFFRFDHHHFCQQLQRQPPSPPQITLFYSIVHATATNTPPPGTQQPPGFQPMPLFHTLVYAILDSLNDDCLTPSHDRTLWALSLTDSLPTTEQLGFTRRRASTRRHRPPSIVNDYDDDDDDDQSNGDDEDDDGDSGRNGGRTTRSERNRGQADGRDAADASAGRQLGSPRGGATDGRGDRDGGASPPPALECTTSNVQRPDSCTGFAPQPASSSPWTPVAGSTSLRASPCPSDLSSPPSSLELSPQRGARSSSEQAEQAEQRAPPHSSAYRSALPLHEWDGTERYRGRSTRLITQQWCSSACLHGLKYGGAMDAGCPNVELHCRLGCHDHSQHRHAVSPHQVVAEIEAELRYDHIKHVMEPILECRGGLSQLFRVLHPQLGYTFAGKGVWNVSAELVAKEHEVYEHLWRSCGAHDPPATGCSQAEGETGGWAVLGERDRLELLLPLSFGVIEPSDKHIDVMYPFWPCEGQLASGDSYNTFLLLSYHGKSLDDQASYDAALERWRPAGSEEASDMEACELKRWCRSAVAAHGCAHLDLALRNLLWCRDRHALVLIDFEHSLCPAETLQADEAPGAAPDVEPELRKSW